MRRGRNPLFNFHPKVRSPDIVWVVPVLYVLLALVLGYVVPRVSAPGNAGQSFFSPLTATSILSAISSGMIAFTGFVFSMLFIMVQFGSSAYTPRLARYLIQEPVVSNSMGIFIATFTYSLLALSQVVSSHTGTVNDYVVISALFFVLGSIFMFILLIRRISSLQITNILGMIGSRGDSIIKKLYPPLSERNIPSRLETENAGDKQTGDRDVRESFDPVPCPAKMLPPPIDELYYKGRPMRVLEFDHETLMKLAQACDVVIQIEYGVGDMLVTGNRMMTIRGHGKQIPDRAALWSAIRLGPQRTIEQDSRFAIRLIVDIAIRALSQAINDPTTAVQALDQLDDLLRHIGIRNLNIGYVFDPQDDLRVLFPTPDWDDFLTLATAEIRYYGADSLQVMRRLRALLSDLQKIVPPERRAMIEKKLKKVDETIDLSFPEPEDRALARQPDRQGISIVK